MSSTDAETCSKCGRLLPPSQQACVFGGMIVCAECDKLLRSEQVPQLTSLPQQDLRMTSETRRVAGPGLLGLEALIPGPDVGYYETVIKDSNGNVLATGYGNTPEESQRIAKEKVEVLEIKRQQAAREEEKREQQRRTVSISVQGRPTSIRSSGSGSFTIGYRLGQWFGKLAVIVLTFVFCIPGVILNKLFVDKRGNNRVWLYSFLFWSFVGATTYLQRRVGTSIWVFGIQLVILSLVNIAVGVMASEGFLKPRLPLVAQAAFVKSKPMQPWIGWSAFVMGLFCLIWSLAAHRPLSGLMPELSAIAAGLMLIRPIPPRIEIIKSSLGLACIVIALFYLIFGWKWNVDSVYNKGETSYSVRQGTVANLSLEDNVRPAQPKSRPRAPRPAQSKSREAMTYLWHAETALKPDKRDFDKAIADCSKAIELDPTLAKAYSYRGWAFDEKGDHEKAIADCSKAIELDPKDYEGYNNRGFPYYEIGDYDKAIADWSKVIELQPTFEVPYIYRGRSFYKKGDLDKAIADYSKAIELDPEWSDAYRDRGSPYFEKGDYDKAIADWSKTIKLWPKDAWLYLHRGLAYNAKGDYDKAWADVKQCQALGGTVPPDDLDKLRKASGRSE